MKKYLMLAIILLMSFSLSACSSGEAEQEQKKLNEQKFDEQGRRMPDFGQPERGSDLMGLVTKVVGNEVTILKIERPERGTGEFSDLSDEEKEEKRATLGGTSGTRMPGMGGGRMSGGTNRDNIDEDAMIEKMKEMSTGEETFVVPVGIQMLKPDTTSEDKPEMVEASLSDIKTDTMITVWLNKDVTEKQVAGFVLVR